MKKYNRHNLAGFTLLEMSVSVAILATLTASSVVLVRTTHTAWNRHEDDQQQRGAAIAILRHIVRNARQANTVAAISSASDTSGTVTMTASNGDQLVWDHDATTKEVRYGVDTATELLAKGIEEFTLVGIKANGVDQTTDINLIHSIRCTVKFNLTRPSGNQLKTVSCQGWLRSW